MIASGVSGERLKEFSVKFRNKLLANFHGAIEFFLQTVQQFLVQINKEFRMELLNSFLIEFLVKFLGNPGSIFYRFFFSKNVCETSQIYPQISSVINRFC